MNDDISNAAAAMKIQSKTKMRTQHEKEILAAMAMIDHSHSYMRHIARAYVDADPINRARIAREFATEFEYYYTMFVGEGA